MVNHQNTASLYQDPYIAVINIQKNAETPALKVYDDSLLRQELQLFPDWHLKFHKSYVLNDSEKYT